MDHVRNLCNPLHNNNILNKYFTSIRVDNHSKITDKRLTTDMYKLK